jgi:hypothetical protein
MVERPSNRQMANFVLLEGHNDSSGIGEFHLRWRRISRPCPRVARTGALLATGFISLLGCQTRHHPVLCQPRRGWRGLLH